MEAQLHSFLNLGSRLT